METISSSSGIRGSVESLIGGRSENQDSYGMSETRLGMLIVVCDGMGGGPAGKTASSIATQAIIDYVSGADPDAYPGNVLSDAVVAANEAVLAEVAKNPVLKGMGTTCVCVLITKEDAFVVHIGDSRCYQLRGTNMVFRTADHSYVGELIRRGSMTEEEGRTSRYSNVITRAIGASPEISPEVDVVPYKPGDRFALMSDGIWGTMPEPQLVRLLAQRIDPAILVPQLAEHIDNLGKNEGGGHDNLTLAIVDIPGKSKTLNDRFSENNSQKTSSDKTAPTKNDDGYVLEEMLDKEGEDVKSSNRSTLTWILGGALLACIAVIAIIIFKGNNDAEKAEKVQETLINNPVNTGSQNELAVTQTADKQTQSTKSESADRNAQNAVEAVESHKSDKEKSSDETSVEKKEDTLTESTDNEVIKNLRAAIKHLESIETFNAKYKDKDAAVEAKGQLVDNAVSCLKMAAQKSATKEEQREINAIVKEVKDSHKILSFVYYKEQTKKFESTEDSNKLIKKLKARIEKLIK